MANCQNQVGVKNVTLTFRDCDTDQTYGPISHELANEEQPQYKLCEYTNESIPGGYIRRAKGSNTIGLSVIRNLGIPLAMYQGCSEVDIQVEHFNGVVISARGGSATGEETSDGHEVAMTLAFREVDEMLPSGVMDGVTQTAA